MSGLNFHTLQIAKVIPETPDASSIVFRPSEAQRSRFDYRPGQFLTLRIPSDLGPAARCYSLSSSPHSDTDLTITVKRTRGGFGSNWLCDNAGTVGTVDVLEPSGTFTPSSLDENFLLVAGGSGITPVMSIVKSVLAAGNGTVTLLYANRDEKSVIFADTLASMAAEHPERLTVLHWLESVQGLPTAAEVDALVRGRAVDSVFVCGPKPFMKAVRETETWRSLPRSSVHIERFASLGGDPFEGTEKFEVGDLKVGDLKVGDLEGGDLEDGADSSDLLDAGPADSPAAESASTTSLTVTLDGDTRSFDWPRDVTLLDFLEAKGLAAPSSCREGICSACECRIVDGKVDMRNNQVLEEEDLAEGYALACQSRPLTDTVTVTYDDE